MKSSNRTFLLAFALTLIATLTIFMLGACSGGPTSSNPIPTSQPQPVPTSLVYPPYLLPMTGEGVGPGLVELSPEQELLQVDQAMSDATKGNIAYNAPKEMKLNETTTVELLLNPSLSEPELVQQLEQSDYVFSDQVEITPRMKAEIISSDKDAFVIQQLHDQPVQIISGTDTTKWAWYVTAKKGGTQHLTIVLYRYVKYQGEEYWREVETYRSDITVKVTLLNKLQSLDWYWLAGILLTALLIPAFWRWMDLRNKKNARGTSPQSTPKADTVTTVTGHAFISYRRSDSADIVGRIYDRLAEDFGDEPIFKDVDDIPLGVDFKEFLDQKVSECTVLLAVIGSGWVNAADAAGNKRLNDPNDFVRIEIEAALARNIPVIPLLVRGASMPAAAELPSSLQKLVYKNGIPIRPDPDFHNDMHRLINALEEYLR
ncbi:MAG: toll/interleukin-1 receptor domain-containing protein [Anaerolineales bacterium]